MELLLIILGFYGFLISICFYRIAAQKEAKKEATKIEQDYLQAKRQYLKKLKGQKESNKYIKREINRIESGVDDALLYGSNIALDNALERLALREGLDEDLDDELYDDIDDF